MKSKLFFQVIAIVSLIFLFRSPVYADDLSAKEAETYIHETGYKLIEALGNKDLEQKYEALDKLFYEDVDIDYLAKFVMGKYWRQMSEAQKTQYLSLFPRYVISVYKSYPLDFGTEGLSFEVGKARATGQFMDVPCLILLPENMRSDVLQNIGVEFKLIKRENRILIVDLKIGESSLLVSYRNRFYVMIAEAGEDMAWFLEDFAMLTESSEKAAAEHLAHY